MVPPPPFCRNLREAVAGTSGPPSFVHSFGIPNVANISVISSQTNLWILHVLFDDWLTGSRSISPPQQDIV